MNIHAFVSEVQKIYESGAATEHSYRSALQNLFSSIHHDVAALNEPKRVKCGAPDFLISRGDLVIGHVEAKNVGKDLSTLKGRDAEQKQRYLKALPNLIYSNCLDFHFYRRGALINRISIADFMLGIQPRPDQYAILEHQLKDFAAQRLQTITSSEKLAEIMAGKAILIKDVLFNALYEDRHIQTELTDQYQSFQEHLIHDITREDFADIYAETVAYGMFAARLHDDSLDDFSRQEALELLPKSNPFLRALFTYIAGADLDDRIKWIIDDLADVFQAVDIRRIMENFGSMTGRDDPFLHFYETFLAKYNPAKRKARGVWYTPEPVVNFIVRAVDDVLKTEFGLPMGLADTSKLMIDWDTGQKPPSKKGRMANSTKNAVVKKEVHRVQILDPATGTGTFLAEVIKQIAPNVRGVAKGMWSGYVERELIPRLHGFELLMASYAMCHMKLDMVLAELGYQPSGTPPRLGVYLTNSLEEGEPANYTLPFAQWLSNEVKYANTVKSDIPIMCVIGNPPYSGESANHGDWIEDLMDAYKREPGGFSRLEEKTSKWINNDYMKFIRLSEHMIERNGEGILGFITDHGYLDNPTFRGMRWHLLKTFDKLYILDLHGNKRKKENVPDKISDRNVFDIQQGVSVIIAIKKTKSVSPDPKQDGRNVPLSEVYHSDLWGARAKKNEALWHATLKTHFSQIVPRGPRYYFRPWDYAAERQFNEGFSIDEFFVCFGNGIVTKRDRLCIQVSEADVEKTLNDIENLEESAFRTKYQLPDDVRDWKYEWARADVLNNRKTAKIVRIHYRPFDDRYIFYSGTSRGFVGWPVRRVMENYISVENIGLLAPKALCDKDFAHVFVASRPSEAIFLSGTTGSNAINFPLYTVMETDQSRRINFDPELYSRLKSLAADQGNEPNELDAFDYIYGVLHSREYRSENREFLTRDFPHIPWPSSSEEFWRVAEKGGQLRRLHLMQPQTVGLKKFRFEGNGDGIVSRHVFKGGAVWINQTQRFENVPAVAWNFFIGGYQPAQKWLKDRKGQQLDFDEIVHYQNIINTLLETNNIMDTIKLNPNCRAQRPLQNEE